MHDDKHLIGAFAFGIIIGVVVTAFVAEYFTRTIIYDAMIKKGYGEYVLVDKETGKTEIKWKQFK